MRPKVSKNAVRLLSPTVNNVPSFWVFPISNGTLAAFPTRIRCMLSSNKVVLLWVSLADHCSDYSSITYSSITGKNSPLEGPLVNALISSAETSLIEFLFNNPQDPPVENEDCLFL